MKSFLSRSVWAWAIMIGVCAGSVTALSGAAEAQQAEAEGEAFDPHVLYYSNASFFRWNPIGLVNRTQLGYKYMLFDSDSVLLKDSYAGLSFAPQLSPSFTTLGGRFELSPLAVLRVSAQYDWVTHYGTFGTIVSSPTPNADFSDTARDEAAENDLNYSTSGSILTLGTRLQAKVGPIAVRVQGRAIRQELDLKDGDTVYYDLINEVMMPNGGWLYIVDSDLLYLAGPLSIGLRHSYVTTTYDDDDFLPGESTEDKNNPMQRLGPLVAYKFDSEPGDVMGQPTVFMLVNWWLQHRYRTGEDVSQAVPYFVLGYAFNGEF